MKYPQTLVPYLLSLFLGTGLLGSSRAQEILITEFMAVNNSTLADEDGEFSDWLELYNPGPGVVNLGGWFLTDNPANLAKWQFPATNLAANGYLLVFASGKDRATPGAPLHTSFSLSGGGEYIALVRPGGTNVAQQFGPVFPSQIANVSYGLLVNGSSFTLLASGANARAFVPSGDIGTTWRNVVFNDTGWLAGTTAVGYDTGTNYDSAIHLDLQSAMVGVRASAYVRVPFVVDDPSLFNALELNLRYDDGFVAYLNGQEVLRRNAPVTPLWNSAATAAHGPPPVGTLAQNFDAAGAAYTLSQLASAPGPSVQSAGAGSTGSFLRLITDGVNNDINAITFDQTAPGQFQTIVADFEFRVASVDDPADGFAFLLIPTAMFGTNGEGYIVPIAFEEPNIAGVFAVGFDVYPRGSQNDVSVHWDGTERANITMAGANINLTQGVFHHAKVTLAHVAGGANVTVTLTPDINGTPGAPYTPINALFIAGLNPYDCRVEFAGRTGGLNMTVDLDNISVRFGPGSGLVAFETFDLTSALGMLVGGANVLAFHGLNVTAGDGDFLLEPQLIGRDIGYQISQPRFFSPATPGAPNGAGALGVTGVPRFNPPGGIYTNAQTVSLASASSSATIRYTLDGSDPTSGSPVYTSPLTLTGSTRIRAKAFEAGYLPSDGAAAVYTMLATDTVTFDSNLPVIIINTYGGGIVDNVKSPAYLTVIDPFRGRASLRGEIQFQGRIGVELRGSSSLGFPKTSLGIEIQDETGNDLPSALVGMPADSDWVLYAPYTDKSLMRDVLAYDLWEDMGHYSVRRRFVEVFRDQDGGTLTMNDYAGVYVLLEKIKRGKDRVDIAKLAPADALEPEVTGGYIVKKDRLDANDNAITTSLGHGLGLEYPKAAELTSTQRAWLNTWFNQFESVLQGANFADPVNGYAKYIDVPSFIDHHWIVEMPKNIDGYRLSNFMHKDRGGKLLESPIWDWNLSFGNANYLEGDLTNNWYWPQLGDGDYPWFRRLFQDPVFNQAYVDRWGQLRATVFATSNVLARIDAHAALLNEAQVREFARWPRLGTYIWPNAAADVPNTTFAGTVNYLKNYTRGRLAWIDTQFLAAPVFNQNGGPIPPGFSLTLGGTPNTIYFTLDGTDPRLPGGALNPAAQVYAGAINLAGNARVFARARSGATWSPAAIATFVVHPPSLVITEIMYHPAPPSAGNTNDADNFEFLELKNVGATTLNLAGFRLVDGVEFNFTAGSVASLAPGARALVVKNLAAFTARYGPLANIAGQFTGNLANGGERLALIGPLEEPILDFRYQNDWYPLTDGLGFSLVIADESAPFETWDHKAGWRASGSVGGSPGASDPAPPAVPAVVINEVIPNPISPALTTLELLNPTAVPADVSGWFLTDDKDSPAKVRLPAGTVLPAGGYYTTTALGPLSTLGGEVYLYSADANANLTGYRHGFDFEGAESGVSFGRLGLNNGDVDYPAQTTTTFNAVNAGPRVGPVVINEIMYHPPDVFVNGGWWDNQEDEFIELRNLTAAAVLLYDPAHPEDVWRLRGAVSFDFPPNTILGANAYLVLVSFNPVTNPARLTAFRARYGLAPAITVLGPYSGKLDNSSDDLRLKKPGPPLAAPSPDAGRVPYIVADRVKYSDATPWPLAADGFGHSLQRIHSGDYGNEATNWLAAKPTPAAANGGATAPTIATQPQSQTANVGSPVSLGVVAGGAGPFSYQWRFKGDILAGATNTTLAFNPFQAANAGDYSVVVLNAGGFAVSSNATLTPRFPPIIVTPPQSQSVALGGVASFVVEATGTLPLAYQWRFNNVNLSDATNSVLTLFNVLSNNVGNYTVVLTNMNGAVTSVVATLSVKLGIDQAVTFIPTGANWKYVDNGTDQGTSWRARTFNDEAWTNGPAQLGYGDGDEARVISYGPDANNKYTTYYFRRAFVVNDAVSVSALTVRVLRDDGVVMYLNGAEIYRNNMPTGTVTFAMLASIAVGGADEASFYSTNVSPALLVNGTNVLAVEIHQSGGGSSDVSFDAELTGVQTTIPPVITAPPQSLTVSAGHGATFNVTALGTSPLVYQWRFNGTNLPGATGTGYTISSPQAANAGAYTVVVTNIYGAVTSLVANLTVNQATTPPGIVTPPQSLTVISGQGAAFNVVAGGTPPLSYQWRFNGTAMVGATNDTYLLATAQPADGGGYSVVVTNRYGSVTSLVATLTVIVPPGILTPPQSLTVTAGANATISVVATGTAPLGYQWRFNGADLAGATGTAFTVINAQPFNAGGYSVVVTNMGGSVTSVIAALNVNVPPAISGQPQSVAALAGSNVTFNVVATGTAPLAYQWWFQGSTLAGETNRALLRPNAQTNHAGDYTVVVTNVAGAVTSAVATLTITVSYVTNVTLITTNSIWKFLDQGTDQSNAWRAVTFDDSAWGSGPAELGYGDTADGRPEATVVGFGPDPDNKFITTYFRRAFVVADAASFSDLTLRVLRDDSAVVYLNDVEVWRSNLPAGSIDYQTYALATVPAIEEVTFFAVNISPALLVDGTNVLAVEIHQATATSSDISFDLEITGNRIVLLATDSDGDGMPDAWELAHRLNPNDPADANVDADGDGPTNLEEYLSGTDPRDPASVLRMEILQNGGVQLQFIARPKVSYSVQYRANAGPGQWQKLADIAAAPWTTTVQVPDPSAGVNPRRIYRLVATRVP